MAAAKLSKESSGLPEVEGGTLSGVVVDGERENGDGDDDLCDSEQESSTMKTMVVRNQRECGRNPEYYFSSSFRWSRLPMTSPSPMITALSPVSTPLSANQSARSDSGRPEQRPKWLPAGQTPARRSISTARR